MQEENFMNARGRFGLVIPEINSSLDYEFIEGVFAEAKILGYDVIVYTGVFNSIRELRYDNYISGLENIYTLICTQKLDGIIIAAERFHAQDILRKIYDYAVMTSTPCLVLGGETKNAVSMEAEEYSGMYKVTEHLIKEHGCKKLYCLAGVSGHKSSLEMFLESILMNLCVHRVCAKIKEETFAVIVPAFDKQEVENTAQNLISAFESGIRERFGDVTLPEFVAFFSQMNSADIYDIEKTVYEAGQSLYEKRKAQEDSFMDYRQQIYRLRRNITAEPQREWNIDDMAHDIGISRSHLQRLYKQLFSVSIKDDVITARINKAMHLLTYTNIRIQEIAELCGYNNDNHLMRQFKEKTGKTALQYRKETRSHEK